MSRIGKKPVSVPSEVKVSINPQTRLIEIEGPKGKLTMTHRPEVEVTWDESEKQIVCTIPENRANEKQVRAYWGLTRSLIDNMIVGVTKGYEIKLELIGVGWTANASGNTLQLKVGYANTISMTIPQTLDVSVQNNVINVAGTDKQAVGHFAAAIRAKRKPEPYNGKGIKYVDEVISRKQGKAFGA